MADEKLQKTHHAYVIKGERGSHADAVARILSSWGISCDANPDFWEGEFDTFTIFDARALKEKQGRKSFGSEKVFIIYTHFFTHEAQNSLLKVFEEPTSETYFFIITPYPERLLPTLRSRLSVLSVSSSSDNIPQEKINIEKFIKAGGAKRIEILKPIIEAKDKHSAIIFLDNLEKYLHEKTDIQKNSKAFSEIQKMRGYLLDRSPSVKMVLEHVALFV